MIPSSRTSSSPRTLALVLIAIAVLTIAAPLAAAGTSGTWTLSGSLSTARTNHTATLLPNGQVLVAGGSDPAGTVLSSAELFNPASGTWTVTGSMATARRVHTATLLPNGQVLVAGGISTAGDTATAEIYNPATGLWTSTGSMKSIRSGQTALLLPSGKVLVAGGSDASGFINTAELYNPSTGKWQTTGSMTYERGSQAVLLPSGKVLIAGSPQTAGERTAEQYSAGHWTLTSSMNESRTQTTSAPLPTGGALVCGRSISFSVFCEFYTPSSNTWTLAHSPGSDPTFAPMLLLGTGNVLLAGGEHSDGVSNNCLLFVASTNSWLSTGLMKSQRVGHSITLMPNGQVLAVGGKNATSTVLGTTELYTP